jgi:hypothetical protein
VVEIPAAVGKRVFGDVEDADDLCGVRLHRRRRVCARSIAKTTSAAAAACRERESAGRQAFCSHCIADGLSGNSASAKPAIRVKVL